MGSYWSVEECRWVEHVRVQVPEQAVAPHDDSHDDSHDDAAEPAVEELLAEHVGVAT